MPTVDETASKMETRGRDTAFLRYLGWLAGVFLGIYLLPLVLMRMDWMERWTLGDNVSTRFSYVASGIDADVVILGDSSSYRGIDPRRISSTLGMRVVSLPNSVGSLLATNDLALQTYLKHNRAPRLIVLYLAPWNLDYAHAQHNIEGGIFDGEKMLLLFGPRSALLEHVRSHFVEFLRFPLRFYSNTNLRVNLEEARKHPTLPAGTMADLPIGLYTNRHPLQAGCQLPSTLAEESPSVDSARSLRDRYLRAGMPVLVFVAPIPGCGNLGKVFQRAYGEVGAAPPKVMAPGLFADDANYVHLDQSAVPEATDALIAAIRPLLGGNEGGR